MIFTLLFKVAPFYLFFSIWLSFFPGIFCFLRQTILARRFKDIFIYFGWYLNRLVSLVSKIPFLLRVKFFKVQMFSSVMISTFWPRYFCHLRLFPDSQHLKIPFKVDSLYPVFKKCSILNFFYLFLYFS